jgi:hypothetical protein
VRLFRSTNTTGTKVLTFFKGNASVTADAAIRVDGGNSYFLSGNIGVGLDSPTYKLDVLTNIGQLAARFKTTGTNAGPTVLIESDDSVNSRAILQCVGDADTSAFEALWVGANGSVGINETAPSAKLHVVEGTSTGGTPNSNIDGMLLDSTGNTGMTILGSTTSFGYYAFGDTADTFNAAMRYDHNTDNMDFYAGNNIRLTIEGSTGDVGIGATNPAYRLDVQDAVTSYVARFYNTTSAATAYGILVRGGLITETATITYYLTARHNDGTDTGGLRTSSGVFQLVDLSDEEAKQYIAPTKVNGLEIVNGLKVVEFSYNGSDYVHPVGFTSQQAETVFPYMVDEGPYNEETGKPGQKMIAKSTLIPVLVKAVQEQQKQIEELKAMIKEKN